MSSAALLLTSVLALSFGAQKDADADQQRRTLWVDSLKALGKVEQRPIVFDVDLTRVPPVPYKKAWGEEGMRMLADTCDREWTNEGGAQIFTRPPRTTMKGAELNRSAVDWLESIDEATFKKLLTEGIFLSGASSPAQRQGILQGAVHTKPGMLESVLSNPDRVAIRLVPTVSVVSVLPKTGGTYYYVEQDVQELVKGVNLYRDAMPDRTAIKKLPVHEDGELDFGEGDLHTLKELVDLAKKTFKLSFSIDGRLDSSVYFVSGSFGSEDYQKCLEKLAFVKPLERVPSTRVSLESRMKQLFAKYPAAIAEAWKLKGISVEDVMGGKRGNLEDLQSLLPTAYGFLSQVGKLTDSGSVRFAPGFMLVVDAGGQRVIGPSQNKNIKGEHLIEVESNRVMIGLGG